jgi:hypothetical protein
MKKDLRATPDRSCREKSEGIVCTLASKLGFQGKKGVQAAIDFGYDRELPSDEPM